MSKPYCIIPFHGINIRSDGSFRTCCSSIQQDIKDDKNKPIQITDENGIEKAFCCIASNARDFAKFGKLYKDYGKWNNKTIIDSSYVVKSITPRFKESPEYGYGFWLGKWNEDKVFWMQGHLGQYVFVIPEENVIVVRLGHLKGESDETDYFTYLDEAFKVLSKIY